MRSRILIIEDEQETRDLFRSFLEDDGYEIDEAENGTEAFNLVTENIYDLYITDIVMPEMNGIEFLKVLKTLDPDAVVIVVTGYKSEEFEKEAKKHGAFCLMNKPVRLEEFRKVVEQGLLERTKLHDSSISEKLLRMKAKLNTNRELKERVYNKFKSFLLGLEQIEPNYVEFGGPGSDNKIWGKFCSSLKPLPFEDTFSQEEINMMVLSVISNSQLDKLLEDKAIETVINLQAEKKKSRFMLKSYCDCEELVVEINIERQSVLDIKKMKFKEPVLAKLSFAGDNNGLVIISGLNGSGKSSLVDAVINLNNETNSGKIFIINELMEYNHHSKKSIIRHQKVIRDTNSYVEAMNKVLDYSPNMVVIEDIAGPEILDAAMRLVEGGTLVIATMRKNSVLEVLGKLLAFYPEEDRVTIYRRLARMLGAVICRKLITSNGNELLPVKEVLINNEAAAELLFRGDINNLFQLMLKERGEGMITMEQELLSYVKKGLLSEAIAVEASNRPQRMEEMIAKLKVKNASKEL